MKLSKSAEKLKDYYRRLAAGKARKINSDHVGRVLDKLYMRRDSLMAELKKEKKQEKRQRLIDKISVVTSQIGRAEWLIGQMEEYKKDN